ncbi:MAG: phosphonate ABC transporter, permease protein PhnE [Acetobacteraceae bacterium]|nr:phosphonate ABC transporter, permease protein PhnE [Acetobacteraceae bacterium]
MTATVVTPPAAQLAPLARRYAEATAAKRRTTLLGVVIALLACAVAWRGAEIDLPMFAAHIGNFTSYFGRTLHLDTGAYVWTDPVYWFWGINRWSRQLGETVLIAYVGTFTGCLIGFVLCFLGAGNLTPSRTLRFVVKRLLELARTVPELVYALIFVVAFGLGALPGVLAITLHTAGTCGKLFAEVVESIDMAPVEGIGATGGTWLQRIRFGVLPQVLSSFASYMLMRFEFNVRGATVIGFVGAGGIGMELIVAIRKFYYADVSAIILMIIACVMALDLLSERLRSRLLAVERGG